MPYEVVDPAERDPRGLIFRTLTEAMVAASVTDEVWEIADDEAQTRTVMCWPDNEFAPAPPAEAETIIPAVELLVRQADLHAAYLVSQTPHTTVQEITDLVALAYTQGRRAGFESCAIDFLGVTISPAGKVTL